MRQFKSMRQLAAAFVVLILAGSCASSRKSSDAGTGEKRELSDHERAQMTVNLAAGALAERDPTGALQHLAEAEKIEPNNPYLHHTRALALLAKNDIDAALVSAKRSVQIVPKDAAANNTLGKI